VNREPILTVRQPWATAIFEAAKDVENRSWTTDYRGRLWIHASKTFDRLADVRLRYLLEELPTGVILGSVTLLDVVTVSRSRWAEPRAFHWLLGDAQLLPTPVPRRGRPGLTWLDPPR
jgi:hypothetical protein